MYFDTHCHLNFEAFDNRVEEVINSAKSVGVNHIVIPGTDVPTSEKAVAIAEKFNGIYAAVGIHPHHVFEIWKKNTIQTIDDRKLKVGLEDRKSSIDKNQSSIFYHQHLSSIINRLSSFLVNPKVVAIGEVGIDRHIYQKTKYPDYKIAEEFVELQKIILKEQIKLAIKYDKSLILHNREAKKDMFDVLNNVWDKKLEGQTVFHCCEPDPELLEFAKNHKMFIGVDGDISYYKEKQEFIKTVPLEMLVLETDSPFLNPEPLRKNEGGTKNEPKNIPLIAEFVAKLKGISVNEVAEKTTNNARKLFSVSSP